MDKIQAKCVVVRVCLIKQDSLRKTVPKIYILACWVCVHGDTSNQLSPSLHGACTYSNWHGTCT